MFNLQHILYILISGLLTAGGLVLCRRCARDPKTKNLILSLFAITTVILHYSNLWVNYFTTGGNAGLENNHILPVYPCNVIMWMLFIASRIKDKQRTLFHILGEFCFYVGSLCGIIGVVLNINFDATPTLADYDILKGLLSHSTMLFGCLYLYVGGFVKIRVFNTVSLLAGLACFVLCGLGVNGLYTAFGMDPPDGMWLLSNPYLSISPMLLGIPAIMLLFVALCLRERKLPKDQRWYKKLISRTHHA